jgi:hypothetical protein
MKTILFVLTLGGSLAMASAQSTFSIMLDGLQETPPVASPGTGSGTLTLNPDFTITYLITFSGMRGAFMQGHIHGPAPIGQSGFPLTGLELSAPGTLSGMTRNFTLMELSYLFQGLTYVNIHTTAFPNGELRGQILPVPEPTTLALLVWAVAAFWSWRAVSRARNWVR